MSVFTRNRWFWLAGAVTFAFAIASLTIPRGIVLTGISDIADFLLTLAAGVAMLVHARARQGASRHFWILMGCGQLLWACNLFGWVNFEVVHRATPPDPWSMDIFLFVHLIPMIAAVGLRPHRSGGEQKFRAGAVDFLLLMVWWVFLYTFVVFPSQYLSVDSARYDRNYGCLYLVESGILVLMLGIVARRANDGWKRLYVNLMAATTLYTLASQAVNLALVNGRYYTGSLYDIPLIGAGSWMVAIVLSARQWPMEAGPQTQHDKWGAMALGLAMLAILSLPTLGLWTYLWDDSPAYTRTFRLFTVLIAMLILGVFVFIRQYFQDRALIHLLEDSRLSFENEQRLQSHLVQREKLASLGQLVAGAALEIDHPLSAITGYSEKLWLGPGLTGEQEALVRKIVHHSERTRDLISNLLSFAQQGSGEKTLLDLGILLQRSVQMRKIERHDRKIRIDAELPSNLPKIRGDGHQLFQTFVQIVDNALDALEEIGGGRLLVSAKIQGDELLVQFSDSGRGMKEPHRVFDPFYTTKPIGKGTGLGLSAVYGVIQEHHGQISCQNNPEGGALFVLRLPIAVENPVQSLAAGQS
jgi:signal transduction histidine kinase